MQFNDTSNEDGVIQMIEYTLSMEDQISGDSTLLAYFTNLINQWYRIANIYAWKNDKDWIHDDGNQTNLPRYSTNIVDEQANYKLPSDALNIRQVEVKDSSGNFYTLHFLHEDSALLKTQKEQETAGAPIRYRLNGRSIILDPKPDADQVTTTKGLRLTVDRDIDEFETSDTTKSPGIPTFLEPILYYGPSYEYASIHGMKDVVGLSAQMLGGFEGLMKLLGEYYSERNNDFRPIIKRARKNYK